MSKVHSVDISTFKINSEANIKTFKYFYILNGAARVASANIAVMNRNGIDYRT